MLEALHQVAGNRDRIHDFFLILMTRRQDVMLGAPFLDPLGKTACVQLGTKAKQVIPCGLRLGANVVP